MSPNLYNVSINTSIQTAESIKPELVKTSLQLSRESIKQLKLTADKRGTTMSLVLESLIKDSLTELEIVEKNQNAQYQPNRRQGK